jgi:hypothetical protein
VTNFCFKLREICLEFDFFVTSNLGCTTVLNIQAEYDLLYLLCL